MRKTNSICDGVSVLLKKISMKTVPQPHIKIKDAIIQSHAIVTRNSWGTLKPNYQNLVLDWHYNSVVIHHSGNWGYKDPKQIETEHMSDKKWDDVGYHYFIHPGSTIYEGREIVYKGSHVRLANTGKIGILMIGDYDHQWWDKDDTLVKSHLNTLKRFINSLKKIFPLRDLGGHKEYLPNQGYSCPGSELMKVMDQLRNDLSLNAP